MAALEHAKMACEGDSGFMDFGRVILCLLQPLLSSQGLDCFPSSDVCLEISLEGVQVTRVQRSVGLGRWWVVE